MYVIKYEIIIHTQIKIDNKIDLGKVNDMSWNQKILYYMF